MHLASTDKVPKTVASRDNIFRLWMRFAAKHAVDVTLANVPEPDRIAYLLVFGMQHRERGQTGKPVRAAEPDVVDDDTADRIAQLENTVDEANGRVTVIINIFGRSVPMELDHWQVEPL